MAFIAFALEKSPATNRLVSKILTGITQTKEDLLSSVAKQEFRENHYHELGTKYRLFSFSSEPNVSSAVWIIGFIGGLMAYSLLGWAWLLAFPILAVITGFLFTSYFLKLTAYIAIRKAGYHKTIRWYNAQEHYRATDWDLISSNQEA